MIGNEIRRFGIGMFCGLAFGLVDALLAIAGTHGSRIPSLEALWISLAFWGLIGGLALPLGVLLLGGWPPKVQPEPPLLRRIGRGAVYFVSSVLLVSLLGFLLGRPLALSGLFAGRVLPGVAAGFVVSSLGAVLVLRLSGITLSRASLGRAAVLGVVCAALTALVVLVGRSRGLPADIDSTNHQPPQAPAARVAAPRPNVLLIVMDTARADRFSLYGNPRETSPFLKELARESTVYDRAEAAGPWTLPSHASMFTGQFPSVHQADTEHRLLRPEFDTLAEILRNDGYATVGFSSNSVAGAVTNLNQGFDHFYEVWKAMAGGNDPTEALWMNPLLDDLRSQDTSRDKGARLTNTLVGRWLDRQRDQDPNRPFFMFINYVEPHLPYVPPEPYRSRFLKEPLLPIVRELCSADWLRVAFRLMGLKGSMGADAYRQLFALYDAEICYVDARIGELVADLKARRLLDNTLVIIVSDHGENIGEHGGLLDHCLSVNQTLLNVPLIVRYPPAFEPGLRYGGLVSTVSIFPTVLKVAGVTAPLQFPPAVAPLPGKGSDPGLDYALTEYALPVWELGMLASEVSGVDIRPYSVRQRALQTAGWKIIARSDGKTSLYDLAHDPGEDSPLDPNSLPQGAQLQGSLDAWLAQVKPLVLAAPTKLTPLDEKTRESLRSLGYVR